MTFGWKSVLYSVKSWNYKYTNLHWRKYGSPASWRHLIDSSFPIPGETSEEADTEMPKVYEPIESFDHLKERLNMFLQLYNESVRGAGMDLVFFEDAMVHLVKVSGHTHQCLPKVSRPLVSHQNFPLLFHFHLLGEFLV